MVVRVGASGSPARVPASALAAVAGAVAFVAYASLASRDYAAVDGGVRALEVFRGTSPIAGGNNHLLYPAYVRGWTWLVRALGAPLADPVSFLRAAQLLNAVAAALAVGLLFALARRVGRSPAAAALATALFACSHAFLLHATHGSEPVLGFAWSLFGAWSVVRGVDRRAVGPIVAGGAAQAIAMASYQSMVLAAPALALYLWLAGPTAERGRRLVAFVAPAILATAAIYGVMYALSGSTGPAAMLGRFFRVDGVPRVYAGFGVTKTLNLPLGLANAVAPVLPPGYAGLRSLVDGRVPWQWAAFAIGAMAVAASAAVLLCLAAIRAVRRSPPEGRARAAWIAGLVAAACVAAPLAYWNPLYDKLWLQPLALGALAVCALVPAPATWRPPWRGVSLSLLLCVVGVDLAGAVRARVSGTPCLEQAGDVARAIGPRDLLVRGWDPVSFAFGVFFDPGSQGVDLVQVAVESGSGATQRLDSARTAAAKRGGAVYYLGVLEPDRARWDAFLGRRAGLPYDVLESIRARAGVVASYACAGAKVTLWRESAP